MQGLKNAQNIEPQTSSSSIAAPHVFIIGPVRVQTIQKIDGRLMDKLFIDEILELYGSGVKYPSKELINIKPKILKSLPTTTKNIPITVQAVRVGNDYVRIDRKMEIDRSKIKLQSVANTKELVKFGGAEMIDENDEIKPIRKSKSEATIFKIPIFNLIGSLVITAFQNTIYDSSGSYKIYEEIELRADRSTAKPEIAVVPFLRKVSVLPKNKKDQIPIKYQEDILIGYNVMLIKRLIEIKPSFKKQFYNFSLNEERNYVTDKTISTPSSITESVPSNIGKPKMLVLQEPPIRTDFTRLSSGSAEQVFYHPVEPVDKKDHKMEENLQTAIGSSDIINEDRGIVKTFDKFQIIRHSPSINGSKARKIAKSTKHLGKSPTEAFLNAELHTSRPLRNTSKPENPETIDYALRQLADQDESKQFKESISFANKAKHSSSNEAIDSNSKMNQISYPTTLKTARLSNSFRPIYSSPIHSFASLFSSKRNHLQKCLPDSSEMGLISSSSSTCISKDNTLLDEKKNISRNAQKVPSIHFTSKDQISKYNKSSHFFGNIDDKNDNEKSTGIRTARSIPDQLIITAKSSRFPETDEQAALTACELSQELLNRSRSAKKDKQQHLIKTTGNFPDTQISSRKIFSTVQPTHISSSSLTEIKSKNLKLPSISLEQERKNVSIVSDKCHHSMSPKRKYGLLPPTSSIISATPKHSSKSRSGENVTSKSLMSSQISKETFSDIDKKVHVKTKKTSKEIQSLESRFGQLPSRFERFPLQARSTKSRQKKSFDTSAKRIRAKRVPSLISVTQESDDTKSSSIRTPSKWFEKSKIFADQSELEQPVQTKSIVIPISSTTLKSSGANVPTIEAPLASKASTTKKVSSISDTLIKKKGSTDGQKDGTSIMIESKDDENLTIQLNINLQVKNKDGKLSEKQKLKPERILINDREVYRKSESYHL
ncbi:Uncharacterized protein BM_BM1569 [Brugia malayi]|uniref:DUF4758 domain-containing protein n=1 Tax=Brugia malayi TaxID=6279 RepID=A0A4E9F244_BRUMA|nr:Uncharacterized protein BM_BM1569 [Brugia malayi]VIO89914.1 Uncharacterized protein BM_BM1569 [Brugia malayi]